MLSITDSAFFPYMAGFFDGEGSYTVHRTGDGPRYTIELSIANTRRSTLEHLHRELGIGTVSRAGEGKGNRNPLYNFRAYDQDAVRLTEAMMPFLDVKGTVAEIVLEGRWRGDMEALRRDVWLCNHFNVNPRKVMPELLREEIWHLVQQGCHFVMPPDRVIYMPGRDHPDAPIFVIEGTELCTITREDLRAWPACARWYEYEYPRRWWQRQNRDVTNVSRRERREEAAADRATARELLALVRANPDLDNGVWVTAPGVVSLYIGRRDPNGGLQLRAATPNFTQNTRRVGQELPAGWSDRDFLAVSTRLIEQARRISNMLESELMAHREEV